MNDRDWSWERWKQIESGSSVESLTLKRQKENSPSQAVMKEARIGPDTRLGREIDEYDSHSRMNVFILPFICFPPTIFGVLCEGLGVQRRCPLFSLWGRNKVSGWDRERRELQEASGEWKGFGTAAQSTVNGRWLGHVKGLLRTMESPAEVVPVPVGTGIQFFLAAFAAWEQKPRRADGWNKLVLGIARRGCCGRTREKGNHLIGPLNLTAHCLFSHPGAAHLIWKNVTDWHMHPLPPRNHYWPQSSVPSMNCSTNFE